MDKMKTLRNRHLWAILAILVILGILHYAMPNSTVKWVADEEAYTYNLKVERYLRNHEYQVHRLSSWEILNTSESELIDLLIDVLGISLRHFRPKLLALHGTA